MIFSGLLIAMALEGRTAISWRNGTSSIIPAFRVSRPASSSRNAPPYLEDGVLKEYREGR